jgi:hypothetical protein
MPNWSGGLSGLATGAQLGSSFGPWGTAIGAIGGGIAGLFGGGESPEERLAKQQQLKQMERANQFWQRAQGQMGKAESYFAPIAGGSRQAAFEAVAPEVAGAAKRMEAGRQSLLNLSSRSGGAAAMMDPYAKAGIATNILQKVRPMAAQSMMDMAKTTGGWAAQQGTGLDSYIEQMNRRRAEEAQRGAAAFDSLTGVMGKLGEKYGSKLGKGWSWGEK